MKGIFKRKDFWIIVLLVVIIIALIIYNNVTVDGSKGGILEGPSHKDGGIDAVIKGSRGKISLEGNEDILTKRVNEIQDQYICSGTPGGIASALNVEAGGKKFNDGGQCFIK